MGASLYKRTSQHQYYLHFRKLILNLTGTERQMCTRIIDLLSYLYLNERNESEVRHNADLSTSIMVIEIFTVVSYQPTNNGIQKKEINFFFTNVIIQDVFRTYLYKRLKVNLNRNFVYD